MFKRFSLNFVFYWWTHSRNRFDFEHEILNRTVRSIDFETETTKSNNIDQMKISDQSSQGDLKVQEAKNEEQRDHPEQTFQNKFRNISSFKLFISHKRRNSKLWLKINTWIHQKCDQSREVNGNRGTQLSK